MQITEKAGHHPKVAVVGLAGQSAFLSEDHFPTPGETVSCSGLFFELGGKGYNQAIACARLGVSTVFIGAVGDDANGAACEEELRREGTVPCLVKKPIPTAYAVITTDKRGENTVQVFGGAAKQLTEEDLYREQIRTQLMECDYLLLQNELSLACLQSCFRLAKELGISVIFNPAPADAACREFLHQCALITPNFGEAKSLIGWQAHCDPEPEQLKEGLEKLGVRQAVITMGSSGALVIGNGACTKVDAVSFGGAVDTTGAGDTFNGTLCAGLALGKDLDAAVQLAVVAAGISVTRHGAAGSIPTKEEISKYL